MNNMTYLNFLWKMANVEGAFVEDARCGRCTSWNMPNVEGAFVEDAKCGRCPVEGGRGRRCLLVNFIQYLIYYH